MLDAKEAVEAIFTALQEAETRFPQNPAGQRPGLGLTEPLDEPASGRLTDLPTGEVIPGQDVWQLAHEQQQSSRINASQ